MPPGLTGNEVAGKSLVHCQGLMSSTWQTQGSVVCSTLDHRSTKIPCLDE